MKHRPAYWLCPAVADAHRDRANALLRRGFLVEFVGDAGDLLQRFRQKRAATILVGDEGGLRETRHAIETLSRSPELSGVRLILSSSRGDDAAREAALHGFRDIIPFDLPVARWVARFLFSSAGASTRLPLPSPMLSLNGMASVAIPARVDWVSDFLLRLETRLTPPLGARLALSGRLVEALGLRTMGVTVMQTQRHDLRFRFSDAIVCSWDVGEGVEGKKAVLLDHLRRTDRGAPLKVFLAAQTAGLRQTLLSALSAAGYDVVTALHKHSLVHEPRFFNPHLVILEDKLCGMADAPALGEMFSHLGNAGHVLVIGPDGMHEAIKALGQGHKIVESLKIPSPLPDFIEKRVFEGKPPTRLRSEPEASYLAADSEFSRIEVLSPARLTGLHPLGAELALPYAVGNFGLCRIEAPLLKKLMGRKPYAKITASYPDPLQRLDEFPHRIECALGDMTQAARQALADGLTRLYADEISAQMNAPQDLAPSRVEAPAASAPSAAVAPASVAPEPEKPAPVADVAVASPEALAFQATSVPVTMDAPLPVARPVRRRAPVENRELLRLGAIFLAAGAAFAAMLWASLTFLAPNYDHSGSHYSEQLQKFKARRGPAKGEGEQDGH